MENFCQAAVLREYGKLNIENFHKPELGPEDILIRILVAGVCGTDLEIYDGRLTEFPLPLIMGHEIVGEIVEMGPLAESVRGFKIGEKVIVETSLSCGRCEYCLTGRQRHCNSAGSYGLRNSCSRPPFLWGGFSEYLYVPQGVMMHRIPENVSLEEAVLITAVIANGVQWSNIIGNCKIGNIVLIQGAGPQAISCCAAAKESGAKLIIMTGLRIDAKRLELAKEFGADVTIVADEENVIETVKAITGGHMADLVIDVSGSPMTPQLSVDLIAVQGTIIHASQMGTKTTSPLVLDTVVRKEAKIFGVLSKGFEAVQASLKLIQTKRYPFSKMVTHRFELKDINQAFQISLQKNVERPMKTLIYPHML